MASGAFRVRLESAWVEIRENLGRSSLQALGVMLGVAAVLGGFSISDSMRKRSEALYVKMGGLDKLNVTPNQVANDGTPSALQTANRGLRRADQEGGEALNPTEVEGVGIQRNTRARVRSAFADQERPVSGIGGEYLDIEGYDLSEGRAISREEQVNAAAVAIIGSEVARTFYPDGQAVGATLRIGDVPVTVVGVLKERVFRFRNVPGQGNIFWRRNRIIAVPASLVQRRIQGDVHARVDRVTFRMPKVDAMAAFSTQLQSLLKVNHRLQDDVRLDDVAARMRKRQSTGDAYDIIFMLSGVLSLIGGGIVNVNIQLASLKERVREVGVRMAIGASGREVFKEFMTEAILLTCLGSLVGLVMGVAFSWAITHAIGVPLGMELGSFLWAYGLALVFGIVFALFPAWKASKLSPMEALRYE
ncbi:MAG TPA: ABC transporter permease [Holophagaceae bacterium]|nr:ABC transporter permease [Holophagaceae bacterium]